MRKALQNQMSGERRYRIIGVDDEEGILDSLTVLFDNSEYEFYGAQDPVADGDGAQWGDQSAQDGAARPAGPDQPPLYL